MIIVIMMIIIIIMIIITIIITIITLFLYEHFIKISSLRKLKTILNFQFNPIYYDKNCTKVITPPK